MGLGAMPLALFVLRSLELELQHFDDSVGMLVRIVLSASGPVAEDAVGAVCVVVMCSVVAVAVLWHVVAVVLSIRSVLLSLLWAAVVQSDLVVAVAVRVHQVSSSFSPISFSAGDVIRTCSFALVIAVAPCDSHRLLPSTPMALAGPIQCPCD